MTLKQLRLSRLLTQIQVANAIGVTHQSVALWEKGDRRPQLPQMAALAKYFGLTPDEIRAVIEETMLKKDGD